MRAEELIHHGDIYYADLSPAVGTEQNGIRHIVVIQNNMGNRYNPTIIVVAITSRPKNTFLLM